MIGDVLALAAEELSTRNVKLESRLPSNPLVANVDADLLKQAAIECDSERRAGHARGRHSAGHIGR